MDPAGEPALATPRRRLDWREVSRRAGPPFLVFVLLTWAAAWWYGAQRPEPDLLPFLKRAWPMADFSQRPGGSWEVRRQGELLGHAAWGRGSGYGGGIVVAIGANAEATITSAAFLEYRDTPDLMRSTRALLASFLGRQVDEPFEVGRDVDAVTGATASTRGIAEATRAALAALPSPQTATSDGEPAIVFGAAEIVLLVLLVAGALCGNRAGLRGRPLELLRGATLLASLATIGFLFNRPWVIAFPIQLLTGDWPSWRTHLYGYLMFAYLLLAFQRTGKNPYCPWICPFGAAQELVGKLGGAQRRRVPATLLFHWVKRLLLWLAVLLGLAFRSPGAASFEIFGTAFRGAGSGFQIALLVLVAAVAVFFARPFCHWVCPVDTTEQFAQLVRVRLLRLLGRQTRPPRERRPVLLPVLRDEPPRELARRLRDGALTAAGLLAALLVVAHLGTRFAALGDDAARGRMSETFVAAPAAR